MYMYPYALTDTPRCNYIFDSFFGFDTLITNLSISENYWIYFCKAYSRLAGKRNKI